MIRPVDSHGEPCTTLRGAARELGISPAAVRWAIDAGHLRSESVDSFGGAVTLIPLADVAAYHQRRTKRLARVRHQSDRRRAPKRPRED